MPLTVLFPADRQRDYRGDTPDEALAAMRRDVQARPQLLPADLGLVAVPEGAEVTP